MVQDRIAAVRIKVVAQAALFSHAASLAANGRRLGAEASILKIVASELLQSIAHLLVDVAGSHGADVRRQPTSDGDIDVTQLFLQSRRSTIYGGSSEILRNIVARRVLNLPG